MNISRTLGVVTGAFALVLTGLLAVGAYALAQSDGGGPPWRDGAPWHDGDRGWSRWHDGDWGPEPEQVRQVRAELAADVAEELDTSTEQVEAAFRAVASGRLQEAVAAGRIDQAAADEALAAYDEGDLRTLFGVFKSDRKETAEGS